MCLLKLGIKLDLNKIQYPKTIFSKKDDPFL